MKLFLPQTTLEEWALSNQADIQDGHLVVAQSQERYPVTPAVHFRAVVDGKDAIQLMHKVKTNAQLEALGAERMADSVLLGEDAYEVTEGYVTDIPDPSAKASSETDLLAAFLLNKMS